MVKIKGNSFKLLRPLDLTNAAEIALRKYNKEMKPVHYEHQQWLAECWEEGLLTILIKEGHIKLLTETPYV